MMKGINLRQFIIPIFLNFVLLSAFPTSTLAAGKYVFERMWPVLEQPWYFSDPHGPAIDGVGNVYLVDNDNHRYEGTYDQFTVEGVYNIAVFARDRKSTLSLPVQTSVSVPTTTGCLTVASDFSIRVPCAQYNGTKYGFTLKYYQNLSDPFGFYWRLAGETLTTGSSAGCLYVDSDFSIDIS